MCRYGLGKATTDAAAAASPFLLLFSRPSSRLLLFLSLVFHSALLLLLLSCSSQRRTCPIPKSPLLLKVSLCVCTCISRVVVLCPIRHGCSEIMHFINRPLQYQIRYSKHIRQHCCTILTCQLLLFPLLPLFCNDVPEGKKQQQRDFQ